MSRSAPDRRLPERLHRQTERWPCPTARTSPSASTSWPGPAASTSWSPRATGIRPTTASFTERGGHGPCTACRGRDGAELHPSLDRARGRRRLRQGPERRPTATRRSRRPRLGDLLRERGIDKLTRRGPGHRLLREEQRRSTRSARASRSEGRHGRACAGVDGRARRLPTARWRRGARGPVVEVN